MSTEDQHEEVDDRTVLDGHQIETELLADWRVLFGTLHARFETGDFATGLDLVAGVGKAAEAANHHPDVDLSYGAVSVRFTSHDVGGVTMRDVRLARTVSDLAAKAGARARPEEVSFLELGLDTPDHTAIAPFWAAVLGYDPPATVGPDPDDADEEDGNGDGEAEQLADEVAAPDGRGPTVWFQHSEAGPDGGETPAQHWHLDVRVPPEVAERRVRQVLDAGGTLVSDERAPTFWVLADAQGNRACITTWHGRTVV